MRRFKHHLVIAWQNLKRTPIYLMTVILTLGLTLGALSSAFGLSYLLLFEPLPYPNSHSLFLSDHARIKDGRKIGSGFQSYPALIETYESNELFKEAALIQNLNRRVDNLPYVSEGTSNEFSVSYVTPEYFSLFGAETAKGRVFTSSEGLGSHVAVALVSYDFWRKTLLAVPDVLDKTLMVGDVSFKIVGVMSPSFVAPKFDKTKDDTEIWLGWDFNVHGDNFRQDWTNFLPFNHLVARVNEEAQNSIDSSVGAFLSRRFEEETTGSQYWSQMKLTHHMRSIESVIVGDSKITALLVFLGLLGVALLALSNIINLFISRLSQNQKQFTIRVAIGASPQQLYVSIFAEAILLMFLAFVVALAIHYAGVHLTQTYGTDLFPRLSEFGIHWVTILFMVGVSITIACLFSHFAVRSLDYRFLMGTIQGSGKGGGVQISKKTRFNMIVVQIACAGVLLCASVEVATRALDNMYRDLGFDIQNTGMLFVSSKADDIGAEESLAITRQIKAALQANPIIENVSHTNASPLTAYLRRSTLIYGSEKQVRSYLVYGDSDYFDTSQIAIMAGSGFTQEHINSKANVAVVSHSMANALFPDMNIDTDVIGKTVIFGSRRIGLTVVGIAKDAAHPSPTRDKKVLYLPPRSGLTFMVRKTEAEKWPNSQLQERVTSIDPRFQVKAIKPLLDIHADMLKRDRLLLAISLILVAVALVLTMIGIYGAINYSIRLMRYELGVKMVLGATPARITSMIISVNAMAFVVGLLFSAAMGAIVYFIFQYAAGIEQPLTWTSPIVTLLVIMFATLLSNAVPVTEQFRFMPARYLDR